MDPWEFWKNVLHSPRFILAPMVDHSELPWRMLSKEYGCQVTYTPMFHGTNFATSKKYRQKVFTTCPEDRPLIVQFCVNNAETLIEASRHVVNDCNGIDINLGCPQDIARRGHYGAYLQDEWHLISEMVTKIRNNLTSDTSISCKIRIFDETEKTVQYAQMLEKAGCSFIGVHGRTRDQRGCKTGVANWSMIKSVKEAVHIPVIANGNVQSLRDAEDCLAYTGTDAIMTAEGNLYNPAILKNIQPPAWIVARKYLDYVKKYPIPPGMAKSHLFKLFHRCIAIDENADLRARLGQSTSLEQLNEVIDCFEKKYAVFDTDGNYCDQTLDITVQPVPPYLCQPRFRYGSPSTPMTTDVSRAVETSLTSSCHSIASTQLLDDSLQTSKRIKLIN